MAVFKFWKMHGAGNDFIVIPDLEQKFPVAAGAGIRNLCRRPDGIGSEGLILLQPAGPHARSADLRMRFFNPTGRKPPVCGNGARCAARLAADLGLTGKSLALATGAGRVRAECLEGGAVRICPRHPAGPCAAGWLWAGIRSYATVSIPGFPMQLCLLAMWRVRM